MVQCWEADSLTLTATDRGQGSLINFFPPIPRQQIAETEAPPSCDSLTFLGGDSFVVAAIDKPFTHSRRMGRMRWDVLI